MIKATFAPWIEFLRIEERGLLTSAFVLVATLDVANFTFDIVRPTWSAGQHYAFVTFLAAVWAMLFFTLRGQGQQPRERENPRSGTRARGLDPLLTLRAFACALVFTGHYSLELFPIDQSASAALKHHGWYKLTVGSPWSGVWIFFVLSGYLMGKGFFAGKYPINREGLSTFYKNRFLRIFPVYACAIVLSVLLHAPQLLAKDRFWSVLQSLVFSSSSDFVEKPIFSLWSISTEFQFYLVAPFISVVVFRSLKSISTCCLALVAVLMLGILLRQIALHGFGVSWNKAFYPFFFNNIDLFLTGMILSRSIELGRRHGTLSSGQLRIGVAMLSLFVFYFAISMYTSSQMDLMVTSEYLVIVPALSAVFAILFVYLIETTDLAKLAKTPLSLIWFIQPTQFFGTLTFCIYVWHEPVLTALRSNFGSIQVLDFAVMFPIACLVTVAVASGSYYFVEQRFDRRKTYVSGALQERLWPVQ